MEDRAVVAALDMDITAHHIDQHLRYRETEATATSRPRIFALTLKEGLENGFLFFCAEPGAGIPDHDME